MSAGADRGASEVGHGLGPRGLRDPDRGGHAHSFRSTKAMRFLLLDFIGSNH